MLKVSNIEVVYNKIMLVIKGVSFDVPDNQIVGLLGANGAGKTTILKSISGLLSTELGEITHGNIEFNGEIVSKKSPEEIAKKGIIQVMENRRIYEHLTAEENLVVGAHVISDKSLVKKQIEMVYKYFPSLKALRQRVSGYLSGGERQMLVIGQGIMAVPKILLVDEASLGLAPLMVQNVMEVIQKICIEQKIGILLVEQNVRAALEISGYAYIVENGRIVLDGPSDKLKNNEDVKEFYLGLTEIGARKSYKEVKYYRRRKRWLS